jgi:uncharacterized protein (TIRG00374 family)
MVEMSGTLAAAGRPLRWKLVVKRVVAVVLAGLVIYLVLPEVTRVLGAWPRLATLNPIWFAVAFAAETAHFVCTFALQRLALRTDGWFDVVTSQLAGNAITNVMPGADAAGAAVQYRMLSRAGIDADTAVSGLTAFSLLQVGGLLALPIIALPAILAGSPVSRGLVSTAVVGAVVFLLFAGFAMACLRTDPPLALLGRAIERIRNRVYRRRAPLEGFDDRLLRDRNEIRSALGAGWRKAALLTAARQGFDFGCLLAALRATGGHPRPSLILLAYAVSGVIGLLPLTPGGLGVVEASMSGMLVLAGVSAGRAFLATLAYRVASYWLPLLSGPVAYAMFRRRHQKRDPAGATPAT